jgi:hypothetical protein
MSLEPRTFPIRLLAATALLAGLATAGPARAEDCGTGDVCPDSGCSVGVCVLDGAGCFLSCSASPAAATVVCNAGTPGDACNPPVTCDGASFNCPVARVPVADFTFNPAAPTLVRGTPVDVTVTAASVTGPVTVSGATVSSSAAFTVVSSTLPKTFTAASDSATIRVEFTGNQVGSYTSTLDLQVSEGCFHTPSMSLAGTVSSVVPPASKGGCASGPAGFAALALLAGLSALRFARRRR